MALTVYNKTGIDVTATFSSSQSTALSGNGTWQPSGDPTSFTLRITRPSDPQLDIPTTFGPEITSATFQRSGQVFRIVLA